MQILYCDSPRHGQSTQERIIPATILTMHMPLSSRFKFPFIIVVYMTASVLVAGKCHASTFSPAQCTSPFNYPNMLTYMYEVRDI